MKTKTAMTNRLKVVCSVVLLAASFAAMPVQPAHSEEGYIDQTFDHATIGLISGKTFLSDETVYGGSSTLWQLSLANSTAIIASDAGNSTPHMRAQAGNVISTEPTVQNDGTLVFEARVKTADAQTAANAETIKFVLDDTQSPTRKKLWWLSLYPDSLRWGGGADLATAGLKLVSGLSPDTWYYLRIESNLATMKNNIYWGTDRSALTLVKQTGVFDTAAPVYNNPVNPRLRLMAMRQVALDDIRLSHVPVPEDPDPPTNPDVIDVDPVPEFDVSGNWSWSSAVKGPILKSPETVWTTEQGATATYNPHLDQAGNVRISIYKLHLNENNDPNVRFDVHHGNVVDTVYVDFTQGSTGWYELGTYPFSGNPQEEFVKLTKLTKTGSTRASAVRFEVLSGAAGNPAVTQTLYVNSDTITNSRVTNPPTKFEDIANQEARKDIVYLSNKGYVQGTTETLFEPGKTISRGEFITVLVRAMGLEVNAAGNAYPDVPAGSALADAVGAAQAAGLLQQLPITGGNLQPAANITREEMALLLDHAVTFKGKNLDWLASMHNPYSGYTDLSSIQPWARNAVERIVGLGIMEGSTNGAYEPAGTVTRAQMTVILKHYLQTIEWAGPPTGSGWELSFQDEFYGTDLDWDVWKPQNGFPGHILSSRWKENVVVEDGLLKLVTKKEQRGGADWTTASVWVKNTVFEQTYGYWEAKYRYAAGTGLNQSWWMIDGADPGAARGLFEIDINEGHYPNRINMNLHTYIDGVRKQNQILYKSEDDLSADFHTYGLEWNEQELIYYLDGNEIGRRPVANANLPVYPILSTALLSGAGPITDALDGKSMDVDYVRVYRKKPAGGNE
ncbi:S-layer homology domain-containing protein [Paenibacillus ginsengarvi]|uniref:S-layer homology domain-containing protein n=1 Tax=Paenibacillus ginsengarvi TaxID=400777 RepID=UPI0013151613|nr:S-layer homology domain-containing protein [Paenibacillus ginsengarvi]